MSSVTQDPAVVFAQWPFARGKGSVNLQPRMLVYFEIKSLIPPVILLTSEQVCTTLEQ